ncbi:hypothetical protein AV654_05670 [Paenibacillus elgii]|uniref:Uncharacterized protein n=1 Tax=Paenibacillus elgii TaxID=189691 RepID=A0A163TF42_9BACL|nr:hypothetical protein AV654_05670 [Paenibacillus elgii]
MLWTDVAVGVLMQHVTHHMTPTSRSTHLDKAKFFKLRNKSHKTITWGIGGNRVSFNNGCISLTRMFNSRLKQLFHDPVSAKLASNIETNQRPDMIGIPICFVYSPEVTISGTRSDGAPCYRLVARISQDAYGNMFLNHVPDRRFFGYLRFPIFRFPAPNHTPAIFWSASTFKKLLKIRPTTLIDFKEI